MKKCIIFFAGLQVSSAALAYEWDVSITFSPFLDYREVKYSVELEETVPVDEYADILFAGPCQRVAGFDGGGLSCGWPPNGSRECKTLNSTCRYLLREADDADAYSEYFSFLDSYELFGAMPSYQEYPFTNLLLGIYGRRVSGGEVEYLPSYFCYKFNVRGIEDMNSRITNVLLPIIETGNAEQIRARLPEFCDSGDDEKLERIFGKATQIEMKIGMLYSRGTQVLGKFTKIDQEQN